jgi:fructosamine-3-kinase
MTYAPIRCLNTDEQLETICSLFEDNGANDQPSSALFHGDRLVANMNITTTKKGGP